jgi:hypothetical protein
MKGRRKKNAKHALEARQEHACNHILFPSARVGLSLLCFAQKRTLSKERMEKGGDVLDFGRARGRRMRWCGGVRGGNSVL